MVQGHVLLGDWTGLTIICPTERSPLFLCPLQLLSIQFPTHLGIYCRPFWSSGFFTSLTYHESAVFSTVVFLCAKIKQHWFEESLASAHPERRGWSKCGWGECMAQERQVEMTGIWWCGELLRWLECMIDSTLPTKKAVCALTGACSFTVLLVTVTLGYSELSEKNNELIAYWADNQF